MHAWYRMLIDHSMIRELSRVSRIFLRQRLKTGKKKKKKLAPDRHQFCQLFVLSATYSFTACARHAEGRRHAMRSRRACLAPCAASASETFAPDRQQQCRQRSCVATHKGRGKLVAQASSYATSCVHKHHRRRAYGTELVTQASSSPRANPPQGHTRRL